MTCKCGHTADQHRSTGTRVIGAPVYGACQVDGCGCTEFRSRVTEPEPPVRTEQRPDTDTDPYPDSPAVKAWMESGPEPWSER